MATWFVTGGSGFVGRHLIKILVQRGESVRALARSEPSRITVTALGALAVSGDLDSVEALANGMKGCDYVVHAAAKVEEWGSRADYQRINVEGTANVLAAARKAGVKRLVHVGTEAPFATGQPLHNIEESTPFPSKLLPRYPETKAASESLVRAANSSTLQTVVVRPRLIWGPDDTSVLPQLVRAVKAGQFQWIDHGTAMTSTCHVSNVCEGIVCAALRGRAGEAYFLTDGEPVNSRAFLTALIQTRDVTPTEKSIPFALAWAFASLLEFLADTLRLPFKPPVTRMAIALIGRDVTVSDDKARSEIGYRNVISRAEGLKQLQTG